MADVVQNITYASPVADAKFAQIIGHPQLNGYLAKLAEVSAWQIVLTILCLMVAYDQCKKNPSIIRTTTQLHL